MKYEIELRHAGKSSEHRLELAFPGANSHSSKLTFAVDGRSLEAEPVEIAPGVYSILIGGRSYIVEVARASPGDQAPFAVRVGAKTFEIQVHDSRRRRRHEAGREISGPQEIAAPMPGRIVKVLVEENQEVGAGQGLVVIEAMKMQNELRASRAGRVQKIYVAAGAGVESGAKLIRLA